MAQDPESTRGEAARRSGSAQVKTVACLSGVSLERGIAPEEIGGYVREAANVVWVDVQDPGPEALAMLEEEFGFHPLALEDVSKGQQRPKLDEYRGYLFLVAYSVVAGSGGGEPRTLEVSLFVGRNYVVSAHRGRVPALEDAYARWTRGGTLLREGVGFLVYVVLDAMIDAYFPVVDSIANEIDETELEMFTRLRPENVQRLLRLQRQIVTLRRVLHPLREVFDVLLRHDRPVVAASTHVYLKDVLDHSVRMVDVLDGEREMVASALEAHLTIVSNRLNMTMKTLSLITVVVAIFGATFGAWGMNFSQVPFADEPWGFWGVVAGSLALVAIVLGLAWRRGWL
jgi:magnesium transporter